MFMTVLLKVILSNTLHILNSNINWNLLLFREVMQNQHKR